MWPEFGLLVCLTWGPKQSCHVLTGWHHHLLISSRSFHRLIDKAVGQRSGSHGGLGSVVWLLRLCLFSVVSEQHPIKSQRGHSGSSKRERGKKTGTKREQEEEVGKGEGRSDELSVAWEEGTAQGYDWLQAGSEFKTNAQAPALCNGGSKENVGHREGLQTRKAGLGERKQGKKSGKEKKNLWRESATKCPDLCGSLFLQMLAINYKTPQRSHTLETCSFFRILSFLNYLQKE